MKTAPITTAPASSPATPATGSPEAAALKAKIARGLDGLTSAHVAVDAGTLGGKSVGDFSYKNGTAVASDITLAQGGTTRVITIGSKSYAKLPAGRNTSGKPWVVVSATSKNEFVRALASTLSLSKAAASLPAVADLAGTASSVTQHSNTYSLVIEPAKSAGTALGSVLAAIGQASVPVDVTLDGKGRPTRMVVKVKLGTQTLDFTVDVTNFDAPVHITAPPANEVGPG